MVADTLVHHSVMPLEVIEWLQPTPNKLFVDGTLGGAGHTKLLLEAGAIEVQVLTLARAVRQSQVS